MYEYINQHSLVVRSKRRESHYFDWRYNTSLPNIDQPSQQTTENIELHRNFYLATYFEKDGLSQHPSLMTGESTPSYLLHANIGTFLTVFNRVSMLLLSFILVLYAFILTYSHSSNEGDRSLRETHCDAA